MSHASSQWEWDRACLRPVVPGLWDVDASEAQHLAGRFVCRKRCPVFRQCDENVRTRVEGGEKVTGLIAGVMWDDALGEQTVKQWHETHGAAGGRLRGSRVPKDLAQWEAERVCASPECLNTFTVTRRSIQKLTCSERCSIRKHQLNSRARYAASRSR